MVQDLKFYRYRGTKDCTPLCAISYDYSGGNIIEINITKYNKSFWRRNCQRDPVDLWIRLLSHESLHKALYSTTPSWKFKRAETLHNLPYSRVGAYFDGYDGLPIKLVQKLESR